MHALTLDEIAAGDPILGFHRFVEQGILAAVLGATKLPHVVADAAFATQEKATGSPGQEGVTHDELNQRAHEDFQFGN